MAAQVEPWLRNTHSELDALRRQVVHALELTGEDGARWCEPLTDAELEMRPLGLPSVAFQMRHIARSLDRLLTYAEGEALSAGQRELLDGELVATGREALFREFAEALSRSAGRVRGFAPEQYEERRFVGRDRLPVTVGALLVHCAEHTQRHSGQMVTTGKVVLELRELGG